MELLNGKIGVDTLDDEVKKRLIVACERRLEAVERKIIENNGNLQSFKMFEFDSKTELGKNKNKF